MRLCYNTIPYILPAGWLLIASLIKLRKLAKVSEVEK